MGKDWNNTFKTVLENTLILSYFTLKTIEVSKGFIFIRDA